MVKLYGFCLYRISVAYVRYPYVVGLPALWSAYRLPRGPFVTLACARALRRVHMRTKNNGRCMQPVQVHFIPSVLLSLQDPSDVGKGFRSNFI